jgi:IS5 family transposase
VLDTLSAPCCFVRDAFYDRLHIEEPDVLAVADGDDGYEKSAKIALLLKEEINTPLRKVEHSLNGMLSILDVFGLEKLPDHGTV